MAPGRFSPPRRGHRLKFFKLWLYLLIPLGAVAQTPSCNWKQSVTASGVGTSNPNNTLQPTCNSFVLTWTSTGFTGVTIQLESSNLTGSGFAAFTGTSTVIAGTTNPTTALSGAIIVQAQTVLSFIRFNVTAATGSGTISTQIYGFSGISPAASAASGGGGGGGAIQTETWTVGTGGITAGDLVCVSQTGSPTTAIKCPLTVVFNQIEIAIIGIAQTTTAAAGSGTVIVRGLATCLFDTINAPTAGHLAQISLQTAGRCQDSGFGNANFGVPVLGVVMTTGLINTTQSVYVFSSGLVGSAVRTVAPLTIVNPASGTNYQIKAGNATSAQGTGTKLQFSTGSTTTNNCVKYDANGNTVDAGAACGTGSGTVTSVTASSPLASSGGATPDISVASSTGSGAVVLQTSPTITTPTIASFTNATHTHANAAGGAQLDDTAVKTANKAGAGTLFAMTTGLGGSGNCANWTANGVGDAGAPCGSGGGSGGGVLTYSGPTLSILSGTAFCPVGGGGACSAAEPNVDIDSAAVSTVSNMYVQLSQALGAGNSVAVTWRLNASSKTVTCTVSGALATACNDTTHSFAVAQGDLLDYQLVFTGTIIVTPTITIMSQFGTVNAGITSVSATAPITSTGGTTPVISATYQGNGTKVQASTGTTTTNDCVKFDANGNTVDAGAACATGTVTSVGFTGGLISVGTPTTTPALTVAGTSGGVPYFASGSTWASSPALTANGVVIGGGAGVAPGSTAAGTTGQVLTGVTGSAPTFQSPAASGALVLLEEHTVSGAAAANFTTRNVTGQSGATIQSDYDTYEFLMVNVQNTTTAQHIVLQVSTDGGSTYDTGSNYNWAAFRWTTAASAAGGANGTTSINLNGGSTNVNTSTVNGTVRFFTPQNTTTGKVFIGQMNGNDGTGYGGTLLASWNTTGTAFNAFRVQADSGNFTGTIRLYGIAK